MRVVPRWISYPFVSFLHLRRKDFILSGICIDVIVLPQSGVRCEADAEEGTCPPYYECEG